MNISNIIAQITGDAEGWPGFLTDGKDRGV